MSVVVKRVYEPASDVDGVRILVDRLWPRGVSKEKAKIDIWLKELGPSNELRKAFHSGVLSWGAFQKAYERELRNNKALVNELKNIIKQYKKATLLFSAKDVGQNNAVILEKFLRS